MCFLKPYQYLQEMQLFRPMQLNVSSFEINMHYKLNMSSSQEAKFFSTYQHNMHTLYNVFLEILLPNDLEIRLIDWDFMLFSTIFHSYYGGKFTYLCVSWF